MNPRIPHTISARWPTIPTGRIAGAIRTDSPDGCAVALVGLPDDTGVKLNGGRVGAREGPAAFRAALAGFGVPWDGLRGRAIDVKVYDAGDVEPAGGEAEDGEAALFETHARVEAALAAIHRLGMLPICIGGGHDLTLPTVRALAKHVGGPVGGVNVDAHLDVRTRVGSGMPFRRLIEGGHLDPRRFVEYGLGRFSNDAGDLAWLRGQGATLVFADEIWEGEAPAEPFGAVIVGRASGSPGGSPSRNVAASTDALFLSLDLDAIDGSQTPGVSAINPCGLSVRHAAAVAEAAGRDGRVGELDIMELSPPHDVAGRTARVAAYLFLSFLAGFAERNP